MYKNRFSVSLLRVELPMDGEVARATVEKAKPRGNFHWPT
jgi:hypothetical protein